MVPAYKIRPPDLDTSPAAIGEQSCLFDRIPAPTLTHDVLPHHHALPLLHAGIFGSLAFLAAGVDWNSVDPLHRRVICIFALAGRIRRAAAQRVYEIIHAVPAVIDSIATTAVGLALQQPQFTRQNRKIRDADRTAHK